MTRARAQALHQEVNSLLSTYAFDTPLDGLLLHANTLCSIRYIDQEASHGDQANEERAGNDEDGTTASRPELPPPRTGTSGQIPSRCLSAPRRQDQAGTSAPRDRNFRPPELPPKFRPSSESRGKPYWMLLRDNGAIPEQGRNLAGTSAPTGTSACPDRNFRPWPELPPKLTGTSAPSNFSKTALFSV